MNCCVSEADGRYEVTLGVDFVSFGRRLQRSAAAERDVRAETVFEGQEIHFAEYEDGVRRAGTKEEKFTRLQHEEDV